MTSKFVKNTPQLVVFSTLFSFTGNKVKHGFSCLIYNMYNERAKLSYSTFCDTRVVVAAWFDCWLIFLIDRLHNVVGLDY